MEDFLLIAESNQNKARKIIDNLQIENIWESLGAEINLVGSLKMGLLMKHLDIDFHVYTETVSVAESFLVILKVCQNPRIKKFSFKNLLNTDENCLEWHLIYGDENNRDWQIDIIHMPFSSRYYGYFENVADRVSKLLTVESKKNILKLKYETRDDEKIMGIEYYKAVLDDGIKTPEEFREWRSKTCFSGLILWTPKI